MYCMFRFHSRSFSSMICLWFLYTQSMSYLPFFLKSCFIHSLYMCPPFIPILLYLFVYRFHIQLLLFIYVISFCASFNFFQKFHFRSWNSTFNLFLRLPKLPFHMAEMALYCFCSTLFLCPFLFYFLKSCVINVCLFFCKLISYPKI